MAKAAKPKPKPETPAKRGRKSIYTDDLGDRIAEAIATSARGLDHLHRDLDWFPVPKLIYDWKERHPTFREKYARAKERQAAFLAFEALQIADDGTRDYSGVADDGRLIVDHDHIARSKLRYEARRWLAGKLAPKSFGDRVEVAGDPDAPFKTFTQIQIELVPGRKEG